MGGLKSDNSLDEILIMMKIGLCSSPIAVLTIGYHQ